MAWPQIIYYIIVLILSIALAPKPPSPRPASLEDFDLPTAEADRPIPWIFGTVRVTGPNVVWFGDLAVKRIKKSGLFSSTTVGYQYYLGIHFVLGGGPWDALLQIEIGEKVAWTGNQTESTTTPISINLPSLFGGKKREGGVNLRLDVMMGEPDQEANAYLGAVVDGPQPGYRGVVSVVSQRGSELNGQVIHGVSLFTKFGYIGNTPYPKPWAFTGRRVLKGWEDNSPWYEERALVPMGDDLTGMNPAHIVYQVLTSTEFGQGEPVERINDAAFRATADALFDEGFGLNLQWAQQSPCDDFIGEICNHVSGLLALDRSNNQYLFKLIRGDYDPEDLPEFGPSEIMRMTRCERRAWGDTINVLNFAYTDPESLKPTAITAHDLGNIRAQGRRLATTVRMPGIAEHGLAQTVAARELLHRSTPLASIEFEINRSFWEQVMGGVVKINWPPRQLAGVVFRILKIRFSELTQDNIVVQAVEDIYSLGYADYLVTPPAPAPDPTPETPEETPDNGQNIKGQVPSDAELPTDPADGDRYIVDGVLVEWDEDQGEWEEVEVPAGTLFFNEDTGTYQTFGGADLEDAPFTPAISLLDPVDDTNPDLSMFEIVVYDPVGDTYQTLLASQVGGGSSPTTTKGDLIVRSATQDTRLPVGTNNQVLIADDTQPLGVRWASVASIAGQHYKLPLTNGDPDNPEMLFDGEGDIVTTTEEIF